MKAINLFLFTTIIGLSTMYSHSQDIEKDIKMYSQVGADYFVSTPFKSFADLDKDIDNVWKVYTSVHGEAKTKEIREKFNAALDDAWSYTYTLSKDLSMQ